MLFGIALNPLFISVQLAVATTSILLILATPIAALLAFRNIHFRNLIESFINLPMVLPPTVIGFYILLMLSPNSSLGYWLDKNLGIQLVFNFTGILIASVIHSFPYMLQPLKNGFQSIPSEIIEASYTLGKGKIETLIFVIIPCMRKNIITGMIMTFLHTLGEFGVVLMIGGAIPGVTRVASIALYESSEMMDYRSANLYAIVLIVTGYLFLLIVNKINGQEKTLKS